MALPADYTSGTITLTNGSPNFTGTGTGWQAADFREGDILLGIQDHAGQVYVVQEITGQTSGVLTQDWAGASGTYEYRMRYEWDSSRVSAQTRTLIELLGNGNLQALANLTGPGVPVFNGPHAMEVRPVTDFINGVAYNVQVDTLADRDAYDGQSAGFSVLVSDVGDGRSALFSKASNASGDWTDPAYVTGPVGPEPEITIGSVTRGDANVTSTPVTGGYELDFTIPSQVAQGDYAGATAYVTGDIVQDQGSSWVALQPTTGNAPPTLPTTSNAFWQLLARAGNDGAGTVTTLVAGDGVDIDSTDPTMPVVSGVLFGAGTQGDVPGPTAGDITADRVLSADGSWVDLPEGKNYDLEISQIALKLAMMEGEAWAYGGGPNGNGYADDLSSLDQIDVAGATNLDTSETGVLKPSVTLGAMISRTEGVIITSYAVRPSACFDGVTNQPETQSTADNTNKAKHFAGKDFSGAPRRIGHAIAYGSNNSGFFDSGTGVTINLRAKIGSEPSASDDGIMLGSIEFTQASNESAGRQITSSDGATAFDFVWLEIIPASGTPIARLAEIQFFEPSTTEDLVVASEPFTADAAPSEMRLLAVVEEVDAAVIGDDYVFEVSRDGTDWAIITMEQVALDIPARKMFSGVADVSGLDPGTSLKWRLSTTAVMVKLHDYVIHWRD